MLTATEVVLAPALSVALAVMEWVPADNVVDTAYGVEVTLPIELLSAKNSIEATLPSSVALAEMLMVSVVRNVVPLAGDVMATVGGAFAGAFTVMLTGAEVVLAP